MKEVLVKDLYKRDYISKQNNEVWELLLNYAEDLDDDVLFDFKNIELYEPWKNDVFRKFICTDNVYMRVYYNNILCNTINAACKLDGIDKDKCFNVELEKKEDKLEVDKSILQMADELQQYFKVEGNKAILEVYKRFDQLGVKKAIEYVRYAIKKFHDKTGIVKYVLYTKNIHIHDSVLEKLIVFTEELRLEGLEFEFLSDNKDMMDRYHASYVYVNSKYLTVEDRIKVISNMIPKHTVGMLARYKSSRALDKFGREGSGEIIICRAAIFLGFKKVDDVVNAVFLEFNGNTFYTKDHWYLDNDGEVLKRLEKNIVSMAIEDLGIYNKFLGKKYHFMEPIQTDSEGYTTMYKLDENGRVKHEKVSIPERIKLVLDDWGIKYNKELLDKCIEKTHSILNKK